MRDSDSSPEFLIDRSLGGPAIAEALRAAGSRARTLSEVYGARGETVADREWLARAGHEGWLVLTRDARIRYRPDEIEAVRRHRVKVFFVSGKRLTRAQIAARIVHNLHRIEQVARKRGPFICVVYERRVERIWPKENR